MQQKIIPHLWFDKEAREAAELYTSLLPNSSVTNITTLHNTPSGDCDIVSFDVGGYSFMAINAGPVFTFNPSASFMINFDPSQDKDARARIDQVWNKLADGGKILMPIDAYPFGERYGWIEDKYGLSWQLMLTKPEGKKRPIIIPFLTFVGESCGKAEEATNHYLSVFSERNAKDTKRGALFRYGKENAPEKEGTIMFTDFKLLGQWFAAMDSALKEHVFSFNEAVSFIVNCKDQDEIDYYFEKLSAVPEAEQCGWLKDKYGVSWQIVPAELDGMMRKSTREQLDRLTQEFLKMKKFDIATLKQVYKR